MPSIRIPLTLAALAAFCNAAQAGEPTWKKHDINPKRPYEAAGVFDVDGKLDIVSGGFWYEGPDFRQSYKVRDVA